MFYYGDRTRAVRTSDAGAEILRGIAAARELYLGPPAPGRIRLAAHAQLVASAVEMGELQQAVADQLNPLEDETHPSTDALGEASVVLGSCVALSSALCFGGRSRAHSRLAPLLLRAAAETKTALTTIEPAFLEPRVPEGYAYYCLYPEMYLASLKRVLADFPSSRRFVVLGIRSIGTSLAGLVAGALREAGLCSTAETVRPRGHPFQRHVALGPAIQKRMRDASTAGARFIVVDEGPGLTCSSFLSVATCLSGLGVAEDAILLLSAWQGAPSVLAPEETRQRWRRMRVYHTSASDAFEGWRSLVSMVRVAGDGGGDRWSPDGARTVDVSYGRWRERSYAAPAEWPVVHRSMERVKLLLLPPLEQPSGNGIEEMGGHDVPGQSTTVIAKFAGLGRYGEEKLARARVLADSGFCPPTLGMAYGFILQPFLPGSRPLGRLDICAELTHILGSYYAFIGNRFRLPSAPRYDALAGMISHNCSEEVIPGAERFLAKWSGRKAGIEALPLALLDGRPRPHEWIEAGGRYLKTDSWDHCADHTLVGEQCVLWDLAGVLEEWGMGGDDSDRFLGSWAAAGGDAAMLPFLDFYRAAYLALKLAELHYAVHSTDEDDIRQTLKDSLGQYRDRLTQVLQCTGPGGGMGS